jgi:hypothetical protein
MRGSGEKEVFGGLHQRPTERWGSEAFRQSKKINFGGEDEAESGAATA